MTSTHASAQRERRRWSRRALPLGLLLGALLLAVLPAAVAQLTGSNFESADANLNADGDVDWNSFTDQDTAANFDFAAVSDPANSNDDDVFQPGTKHDEECPTLKNKKEQNKSDFTQFYFATETGDNGDTFVYLSWQRIEQNTDTNSAHASFIFTQSEVLCPNGQTHEREAGDMLVLFDFEGGEQGVPTLRLSRWLEEGTAEDCQTASELPCWSETRNLTANDLAEGAVNHKNIANDDECSDESDLPGSVFDDHQDECLGTVEFGEAAVNLSGAGVFDPEECINFGSAHLASRASGNSFDASLKDLLGPLDITLNNCGTIIIEKETDPDGADGTFDFDTSGGLDDNETGAPEFSLSDDGSKTYDNVLDGEYTVSERDPSPDFDLTDISCTTADGSTTTVDLAAQEVTIDLEAQDTVTCTFTNTQRGEITIVKEAIPHDSQEFAYSSTELGSFTLVDDGDADSSETKTFPDLKPGKYSVTETVPEDWDLTALTCVDSDSDGTESTGDTDTETATIELDPGESVTCTFENTLQLGRIVVHKEDDDGNLEGGATFVADPGTPDDGSDDVTLTEVAEADGVHCADELEQGDWTVTETQAPADHADADPSSQPVTVDNTDDCEDVDADTTPDATFENEQLHSVVVIVCHQDDDQLAASAYDDSDGDTPAKTSPTSPPSGVSQKELCDYVEANGFTGKEHGEEDYTVDPGSAAHD